MIKLDDFNEVGASNRGRTNKTYIWISGKNCTLNFSRDLQKEATRFFGTRVIVRTNDDLTKFILLRGDGRLVKDTRTVSIPAIANDIREKFGDNIHYLYFNGKWEETDTGIKVYLLELCGKKYVEDATIRTVKA